MPAWDITLKAQCVRQLITEGQQVVKYITSNSATLPMWLCSGSLLLTACDFKQHFVIEAQSEFRHPWQDDFELDGPHNFTAQDAAAGTHLKTDMRVRSHIKHEMLSFRLEEQHWESLLVILKWLNQNLEWLFSHMTWSVSTPSSKWVFKGASWLNTMETHKEHKMFYCIVGIRHSFRGNSIQGKRK